MMASKAKNAEELGRIGPYTSPDYDTERSLPWVHGDRYYLHGSQRDFTNLLLRQKHSYEDPQDLFTPIPNPIPNTDPAELIEIAKRALAKGELEIAEKYSVNAMRTGMLDNSSRKRPKPYFYLAEILEKRAEGRELELLQKQRYLLQAAALYNFVCSYLKSVDTDDELSENLSEIVSRKLRNIEDYLIELCGGDPRQCRFDAKSKRKELMNLRNEVKELLKPLESRCSSSNLDRSNNCEARQIFIDQTEELKSLSDTVSDRMKQFFASIIDECLAILGTPPCDYEVIVFGSLARNETTPYSDFEWAILTSSEEMECKVFFRNLTNLVHLQVINLGETILPSMNIEAITGEWFYDDVTTKGISFDGFLPGACKIPLGNMQDFELIHTPVKMAEFQSNEWYQKNWSLADTLITFSPLRPETSELVEVYIREMDKILSSPCDSECCQHDASCDAWPTRGSCRGLQVLLDDLSRYGDLMTGNNDLDEGKFYDVKKEIYRLTDRVFAALAKCYEVKASSSFAILDKLYKKEVISSEARDNLASASAIAIKLRMSNYLRAGKQGEQLSSNSNEDKVLDDEELFHFFFVAIPLYDDLRQFKTSGNLPSSLENRSFFDDSPMTMGHIYCRLLKYNEAMKCYERALQDDPGNLSAEIRRIRVALFATHNPEESDKIRESLDNLLTKIDQNFSQLDDKDTATIPKFSPLIDRVDVEDCQQLIEGLLFASEIYYCEKYFAVAEKIQSQCLLSSKAKPKELLILKSAFLKYSSQHRVQQREIDEVVSQLNSFIVEEGVSTKSIVWLNRLGEFLFNQDKMDMAYRCFQRALSMGHSLYGTRPNVNSITSLRFLGMIASNLSMYAESKFYHESLVNLFAIESFGGMIPMLLIKRTYLQLALLSSAMGRTTDEGLGYVKNGLKVGTGTKSEKELHFDCLLYCELATILHSNQSPEQAWKAAQDAQACLRNSTVGQPRSDSEEMIRAVVTTLCKIEKPKEGVELLKELLQKFTVDSKVREKVFCLKALGELWLEQGLAPDAVTCYKQAMDIAAEHGGDIFDRLDCLIGISKAVVLKGSVTELELFLGKALDSARKLPDNDRKYSILLEIGKLWESMSSFGLALVCYKMALNTCKEESNISKKVPFKEVSLEIKLAELVGKMSNSESVLPHSSIPSQETWEAQRSHYDRAAVILRQHVATGQVDSETVKLFRRVALQYTYLDLDVKKSLLLETLKVSKIVYGENEPHEMVATILGQLSDTYHMTGDPRDSMKYRELEIEMELKLHLLSPFNEYTTTSLMVWAITSFDIPRVKSVKDIIERVRESFLSSQNDKGFLPNSAAQTNAAKCFTFLAVLFYTSGNILKAKSLNEKASQLFQGGQEKVETEDDACRKLCNLMKTTLSTSGTTLPSHKAELRNYLQILNASILSSLSRKQKKFSGDLKETETKDANDKDVNNQTRNTLMEEPKSLKISSDGQQSSKSPGTTSKPKKAASLDPKTKELLKQLVSQNRFLDSFPEELTQTGDSVKSMTEYMKELREERLSSTVDLNRMLEAISHNAREGNYRRVAELAASFENRTLWDTENSPFDGEEKLLNSAIEEKNTNDFFHAVKSLDQALQLPEAQLTKKPKILKLRGECLLSMGYFRSAVIDFTKACSVHSTDTIQNSQDVYEYFEALIGLIKSEILCDNVDEAWLVCQRGMALASNREHDETINQQAVKFLYLGAKCVDILSERGEKKEDKLVHARSLCQQALSLSQNIEQAVNASNLMGELTNVRQGEFFATKCELQLLLANIFLKLGHKNEAEMVLQEMKSFLMNIADEISVDPSSQGKPEFVKVSGRIWSWFARVVVLLGDKELSTVCLNKALVAFFSAALPDFLSLYEEFLPLLQAITATRSSARNETRSPLQHAVDMCKETCIKQDNNLENFYQFLSTLIDIFSSLGQTQEAMVVAEIALDITDLMHDDKDNNKIRSRCRARLFLAQLHQKTALNSSFDADEEFNLAEHHYLSDRSGEEDIVFRKELSYANFLCERKRFAEAVVVLQNLKSLDKLLSEKFVLVNNFSRAFFGAGVERSVQIDGEMLTTVAHVLYNLLVQAYVGMEKKKEAVNTCEMLSSINLPDIPEALWWLRPPCKPFLVEDCHRELLSLLNEEDRNHFQNCDFPLSSTNLVKLYCMLGEYATASKYFPKDMESSEMLEYLKLHGHCSLFIGNFRTAAIDFTKVDEFYSTETVDNREDLYEYCEVLIGLINSEILCNNVEEAWLVCEKGMKLALDHEFKGTINQQAVKFCYLGAKCVNILAERGENKKDKLVQARSLCQQALSLSRSIEQTGNTSDLMEELGHRIHGKFFATKCEVQLLLAEIFLQLGQKNEAEMVLKELKTFLLNIVSEISFHPSSQEKPEFVKVSGRIWSWLSRVVVLLGDKELSTICLNKSLAAFFSVTLTDFLSIYEEFLPLLQAITATNSSAPDESRSPLQQTVHMCKEMSIKQDNNLDSVYQFLRTLIIIYSSLEKTQEAIAVSEIALGINHLQPDDNDNDKTRDRCELQLFLAQLHQQNASNSAIDANEEFDLAEQHYLNDRGGEEDMVLRKELSYANFLCERTRFADALAVLEDLRNLGEQTWNRYMLVYYFSSVFYGAGVQKSVQNDGELGTTIGDIWYNLMVRAYVGMGQKKEAVDMCEILEGASFRKRPCKPFLVDDCHRELLSLLNEEDRKQFQSCDFPLSPTNRAKLYYMLGEYVMASKYFSKDVESFEMLEMKMSCLCLAGNELVDMNRANESLPFFKEFLVMLQDKEDFLEKPFHNQCEVLQTYPFANPYYVFHSLGRMHSERENVDAAIQCYERCIDLDEDFTRDEGIVVPLSDLYQTKAFTVEVQNEADSWTYYMDLALKMFQKLFQKTAEMTSFAELRFASLLSKLGRYEEAVDHFLNGIKRADNESPITFGNVDKPLVDVYVRREIEAHGGRVSIPLGILGVYELISTCIKLDKMDKALKMALFLDSAAGNYPLTPTSEKFVARQMAGYGYMLVGSKEKAAEIFRSVLKEIPGHPPVTEALESCCM